ncbi:MAG: type II toxin-antitoxin system VapC family toxin [Acidobacteriota bacterium]|nr:type II toxin-antitoxin system VapC family toxin [Acidobacteriota bacterium]
MSVYVTDTHSLLWFTLNNHSSLSNKALKAFESTVKGESFIYIPAIVLWETAILEQKQRIKLNNGFLDRANRILKTKSFGIVPLEPEVIALRTGFNFNQDPFDEMIAAFASYMNLPLITRDNAITDSGLVEIHW